MADNKVTTPVQADDSLVKAKGFWDQYSKPIIIGVSVIVLGIIGWFGYQNFVKLPKEKKAAEAIFPAENLFDKMATTGFNADSINIVLNGGNLEGVNVVGLIKIMNNYGGTDVANRAAYMAGAAYLHKKDFTNAIKYLKEFNDNGATQVKSKADIMLGHAYAEQKNIDEALSYYKKAATDVSDKDDAIAGEALFIAASYADAMGKSKDAIELYQKLKDNFPNYSAVQGGDVDKHLARLGIIN
ncbi:MAG: tetratricopeptide repeat protein [Ferruginibacter sp.]